MVFLKVLSHIHNTVVRKHQPYQSLANRFYPRLVGLICYILPLFNFSNCLL